MKKLVVIDDEEDIGTLICTIAEECGYITQSYTNPIDFTNDFDASQQLIILDLNMPGMDGIDVMRFLAEKNYRADLILVSGYDQGALDSAKKLAHDKNLNIVNTLQKPFRYAELKKILNNLQ